MENLKTIRPLSYVAGWSSLVARQAHNLKVLGSNPSPAPNFPSRFNLTTGTSHRPKLESYAYLMTMA